MRILLIHTAFLGDLVLASPLIRAAAEASGEGRVDLLTSPAGAAVSRYHPLIGSIFVLHKRGEHRGLQGLRRAVAWIRQRQPAVALLPARSLRSCLLAWLAGVPRRIGLHGGVARLLLTDRVQPPAEWHQVERNLALLAPLGVDVEHCGRPGHPLEVHAGPEDKVLAEAWLQARGLEGKGAFFALAPGSVWATKRWPVERFAELAASLAASRPVVIVGGDEEAGLGARILAASGCQEAAHPVYSAAGSLPVTASSHLLSRAAALAANDSAALHLGQAAGIPVVGIFGPTVPEQGYGPRGSAQAVVGVAGLDCRPCGQHGARRCPRGHWRCMLDLGAEEVRQAVDRVQVGAA